MTRAGIVVAGADEVVGARRVAKSTGAEEAVLLGPNPLIIANSAGRNPDKNLNGLTIEMEACLSYTDCTSALQENFDVGAKPTVSALWLTHGESMPAEQQCATARRVAQEMPWVQMGTDFFDGSYILCDSPAKRQ